MTKTIPKPQSKKQPRNHSISVCILTCNRDALLAPLLKELLVHLSSTDEIRVLDTGKSESTANLIQNLNSAQLHYHLYTKPNFDFATARNQLLDLATREIIAFIDDDAFPFPNWLTQVRENLNATEAFEASGGATVADGEMPSWWDPRINWCIGLSPPGTILGEPGYYPDTCNMAADRTLWDEHPFQVVPRESRQLYATGREDAEWWRERRMEGRNVQVNFRQAVSHHIHPDRLTYTYIKRRARNDGVSSWLRRPHMEAATAIPWDLAHIAGIVADKTIRNPFDKKHRLTDTIWMQRQWGKFRAVWHSPLETRPRHRETVQQLGKAATFQLRIRAGKVIFHTIKALRRNPLFPATTPKAIFVSADCFVGDTILLRRHVQALAVTFSESKILVSCRFPALMAGLADNVDAVPTAVASTRIREKMFRPDAAIVPYFPFGDHDLWRKQLSAIGATFDCDVSFAGRRDTIYARRIVSKNMELHEHENLARLFRLWPLKKAQAPPPPVDAQSAEWVDQLLHEHGAPSDKYVLVQFGAGHESKEWPLDCWIPFLREFSKTAQTPIIITGGANWKDAAGIAAREIQSPTKIINTAGCSLEQLTALVSRAAFFIGGCSGPKHLAMSYRVPTFTLYAASEPQRWGAVEDHHLHAYANALPQKLSGMELRGLTQHHRIRILDPIKTAQTAYRHFAAVAKL